MSTNKKNTTTSFFQNGIEVKLDEADKIASQSKERLSHKQVFSNLRKAINKKTYWMGTGDI